MRLLKILLLAGLLTSGLAACADYEDDYGYDYHHGYHHDRDGDGHDGYYGGDRGGWYPDRD